MHLMNTEYMCDITCINLFQKLSLIDAVSLTHIFGRILLRQSILYLFISSTKCSMTHTFCTSCPVEISRLALSISDSFSSTLSFSISSGDCNVQDTKKKKIIGVQLRIWRGGGGVIISKKQMHAN